LRPAARDYRQRDVVDGCALLHSRGVPAWAVGVLARAGAQCRLSPADTQAVRLGDMTHVTGILVRLVQAEECLGVFSVREARPSNSRTGQISKSSGHLLVQLKKFSVQIFPSRLGFWIDRVVRLHRQTVGPQYRCHRALAAVSVGR
jgi:hypothetical protein